MAYNLAFNLRHLQCIKKTKETNGDEIVLCGIGMNRLGEMNFIRPRFLGSGIMDNEVIMAESFTEGGSELFKVDLKDKFKLNYLVVLW